RGLVPPPAPPARVRSHVPPPDALPAVEELRVEPAEAAHLERVADARPEQHYGVCVDQPGREVPRVRPRGRGAPPASRRVEEVHSVEARLVRLEARSRTQAREPPPGGSSSRE